jgi:hypothetical protein
MVNVIKEVMSAKVHEQSFEFQRSDIASPYRDLWNISMMFPCPNYILCLLRNVLKQVNLLYKY